MYNKVHMTLSISQVGSPRDAKHGISNCIVGKDRSSLVSETKKTSVFFMIWDRTVNLTYI